MSAWQASAIGAATTQAPIAIDIESQTIYIAALGGGVLRSRDGGASFVAVNHGLPARLDLTALSMAADDPQRLLVATHRGVFRSVDGGDTWSPTGSGTAIVLYLERDPSRSRRVYAGGFGACPVRRSEDDGASWEPAGELPARALVWSIATIDDAVYIGTAAHGAWLSRDRGISWTALPLPPVVWALAVDPRDPKLVYAGLDGDGVWKSVDGGAHFAPLGAHGSVVHAIAIDPSDGDVLYAATATGLLITRDRGRSWDQAMGGTIALNVRVPADRRAYVGTSLSGVHVVDADETKALADDLLRELAAQSIYSIVVDPSDSAHLIVSANDGGIVGSRDGGCTWPDRGTGFSSRAPRKAAFDPIDPTIVYAGSFAGGGIYRSEDNGRTWTRRRGIPTLSVWSCAVDPQDRSLYMGTNGGGLWRTTNACETQARIDDSVLMTNIRDVVFDPRIAGRLYVASLNGLWRSLDAGRHLTKVLAAATVSVVIAGELVYAGTRDDGVWCSLDAGTTFFPCNEGLGDLRVGEGGGLAIDPTDPRRVYVGTENAGVWKSDDGGSSWRSASVGLHDPTVSVLAIDPQRPTRLYLGGRRGVFISDTGGE